MTTKINVGVASLGSSTGAQGITSDKIESRNGAYVVEVGPNKSSKTALYPGSNSIISSEEP